MQSTKQNLGFVLKLDTADQLTTLQSERQSNTGPELQNRFKNAALLWTVVGRVVTSKLNGQKKGSGTVCYKSRITLKNK